MGRVAAIDYGRRRLGLALSDPHKVIASPHKLIEAGDSPTHATATLLKALPDLERIVIGLPLLMNGKEGEMCAEVRAFAASLAKLLPHPITFWDERLSSKQVESLLSTAGLKAHAMKERTDSLAAAVLLQNYLDAHS